MSGRPIAVVKVRQLSHHSIGVQLTDGADKRHALGVCHTLEVLSYGQLRTGGYIGFDVGFGHEFVLNPLPDSIQLLCREVSPMRTAFGYGLLAIITILG